MKILPEPELTISVTVPEGPHLLSKLLVLTLPVRDISPVVPHSSEAIVFLTFQRFSMISCPIPESTPEREEIPCPKTNLSKEKTKTAILSSNKPTSYLWKKPIFTTTVKLWRKHLFLDNRLSRVRTLFLTLFLAAFTHQLNVVNSFSHRFFTSFSHRIFKNFQKSFFLYLWRPEIQLSDFFIFHVLTKRMKPGV